MAVTVIGGVAVSTLLTRLERSRPRRLDALGRVPQDEALAGPSAGPR